MSNKGERIVIKKFSCPKELYNWLEETDMNKLKKEMTDKYGKNKGEVDLETSEFVILKTN